MGFSSSLGIGVSALLASQRAVDTIAHNIANASVEAYTRQQVNIASATPTPGTPGDRGSGMYGTGVRVVSVTRMRDQLADISYRSQASTAGAASARSLVLDNAQQVLGTLDSGTPADLAKFYAAWAGLSHDSKGASSRQAVLDAGKTVATDLNQAAQSLTDISNDSGLKMTSDVSTINNLSAQVAQLNQQIQAANASANTPNDLIDTRDKALDQLSSLAGVTLHPSTDGRVDVFLGTQSLVRGGDSFNLALTATGGTYALSMAAPPNGAVSAGGELGGYMDVVNNTLPSLRAQMDSVANSLISTVNTAHQAGYDLNGTAGLAFFSGTTAGDISVNGALTTDSVAAAAQPATPNDGDNALAISKLKDAPVNSTGTVADGLRALAARFGSVAAADHQTSDAASTALNGYAQYRASVNGVSVDSEMVDMIKYQRSYQAAAKIISTTDSMLDTLINGLGI